MILLWGKIFIQKGFLGKEIFLFDISLMISKRYGPEKDSDSEKISDSMNILEKAEFRKANQDNVKSCFPGDGAKL